MDILDFFTFEAAGMSIDELETPVPVIDIDIVDRNLRRWQERCDAIGIANRPHIKTHKLVALARYQIALGAKGITVQKLGEAEVMVAGGPAHHPHPGQPPQHQQVAHDRLPPELEEDDAPARPPRAPAWMSAAKSVGEAQAQTLKTVGELVDQNPRQAAVIVRDWLSTAQ